MSTSTMKDIEQPLLSGAARPVTVNKGKVTLAKVRAVLMPKRKYIIGIQMACLLFYVVAIFNMAYNGKEAHGSEHVRESGQCLRQHFSL